MTADWAKHLVSHTSFSAAKVEGSSPGSDWGKGGFSCPLSFTQGFSALTMIYIIHLTEI